MPGWVTAPGNAACACKSQLASLLDCHMPLKLGLPSTRAGREAGAWPAVCVIEAEMTAPMAAAAMASAIIEPDRRSSMMASLGPHPSLPACGGGRERSVTPATDPARQILMHCP